MGMKIGIFDSGLGGLSVLNEALNKLSEHEFLYYADVKNVPYGQKSRDEILKFSFGTVCAARTACWAQILKFKFHRAVGLIKPKS